MAMRYNRQLPLPEELKGEYPLSLKLRAIKEERDREEGTEYI